MFLNIESIEIKRQQSMMTAGLSLPMGNCAILSVRWKRCNCRAALYSACVRIRREYLRELPRLKASGLFRCC